MGANRIYLQVDFQSEDAEENIKKLNQQIAATGDNAKKATTTASAGVKSFSASIEDTQRAVFGLGEAIASMAIVRMGADLAQTADKIQRIEIAFKTLTGSAQQASDTMQQLRDVAKGSPFAFEDLAAAGQKLKAFGMEASKIPTAIHAISAASANIGGTTEQLEAITRAIGMMYAKDEAGSQELFRGMLKQGLPVLKMVQDAIRKDTGKLLSEEDIRKLIEQKRLGGRELADALIEGMEERFGKSNEVMDLVTSKFTKLSDEAQKFARVVMRDLGPTIGWWIDQLQKLVEWFEELPEPLRKVIEYTLLFAGALGVASAAGKVFGAIFSLDLITSAVPLIMNLGGAFGTLTSVIKGTVATGGTFTEGLIGGLEMAITGVLPILALLGEAIALIGAAFAGWEMGMAMVDHLEEMRQKKQGPFADQKQSGGGPLDWIDQQVARSQRAAASWLTDEADKQIQAQGKQQQAVEQLLFTNKQLREKAQKEGGPLGLTGLAPLAPGAGAEEIAAQNRAILQRITDERTRVKEKLIQDDKETLKRLDDETRTALDHAKAGQLGGIAAIKYEFAELWRKLDEAGLRSAFGTRVAEAERLKIQKVTQDNLEKSAQEAISLEHQRAAVRIEGMKQASDLEVELAKQTASETADAKAAAVVQGYEILQTNQAAIRAAERADIDKREQEELQNYTSRAQREKLLAIDRLAALKNIFDKYTAEREKSEKDSIERVAKYREEMERSVLQQAQADNEAAAQLQQQNQLDYVQHAADLRKAAIEAMPAQTEQQKTAQANAVAAAEIQGLTDVYETQKRLNQDTFDAKMRELEVYQNAGIDVSQALAAADAANTAQRQKLDQDYLYNKQKAEIEAVKKYNEAVIAEQKGVYDSLKNALGGVWDAMTRKGQSFWDQIANMAKTALMGALKEIVTSHAAAALTEAFGYGHVGFGGGRRGLLGSQPIFGGDKLVQPGHLGDLVLSNGSVPVTVQNWGPPANFTQNVHMSMPAGTSTAQTLAALTAMGAAAASGGYPSGSGYATSSTLNGESTGQETIRQFANAINGGAGGSTAGASSGAQAAAISQLGSLFGQTPGGSTASSAFKLSSLFTTGGFQKALGIAGPSNLQLYTNEASNTGVGGLAGLNWNLAPGSMLPALGLGAAITGLATARHLGTLGAGGLVGGAALGAFSGALGAGALTAMFPVLAAAGPFGIIAGAAIGAAIGLSSLFIKTQDQQIRDKVKQVYGIDISNKNVRMQIAQIAQQKYGGSISMAVMSPEVQQLVRLYALETGKGAALPRPMYAATLSEGASGLNLLPVYAGGQAVANPYSGTTTTQWSSFGAGTGVYVQLDPGAAAQLMTGQVVNILANNPGSVAAAASAGIQSGVTRDATAQSLIAPLTVMR